MALSYRLNIFSGLLDLVNDVPTFPSGLSFAYGSQTVNAGFVLNEDGTYALNEDGTRILLESGIDYALNEDNTYVLGEDGKRTLNEDSTDPDTVGVATELIQVPTGATMVWVTALSTNYETLRIGGSDVTRTTGVPLPPGATDVYFPIEDVSDLYIIGYYGDGVTFTYGYPTPATVGIVDDSGNIIRDDSGNIVTDDDGN